MRSRGGFTLLELILVLLLISTVLAMAAPSLRGFCASRETADAAARLLALTQFARSHAAAEGRDYRLYVDAEARTCWLAGQQSGAFVETKSGVGRGFDFPDGLTVRLVGGSGGTGSPDYVQFHPDGRAEEATIEVTGRRGGVFRVVCESATERFRVLTPAEGSRS